MTTDTKDAVRRVNEIILIGEVLDEAKYDALVAALAAKDERIAALERQVSELMTEAVDLRSSRRQAEHDSFLLKARAEAAEARIAELEKERLQMREAITKLVNEIDQYEEDPERFEGLEEARPFVIVHGHQVVPGFDYAASPLPAPVGDVGELVERLAIIGDGPRNGFGTLTIADLCEACAEAAARLRAMDAALGEITNQDEIELALDPDWARRIARAARGS